MNSDPPKSFQPEDVLCVIIDLDVVVTKGNSNSVKVPPDQNKGIVKELQLMQM